MNDIRVVDGVSYFVEACPFCGQTDKIELYPKEDYEALCKKNGGAMISIKCERCDAEMDEFSFSGIEYERLMSLLVSRWNRRKNGTEED